MNLPARSIVLVAVLLPWPALAADPPLRIADVVAHLARTIAWYRHVADVQREALPPADVVARDSARGAATRSLQLAFEFGRAAAPLVAPEPDSRTAAPAGSAIERRAARAVERVANAEAAIAQVDAALAQPGGPSRAVLAARRKELVAELEFAKQIRDSVQSMRTLLTSQATGGVDLLGFVDRLERSVPEALRATGPTPPDPGAANDPPFRPDSAGIFALITETFGLSGARALLDAALAETDTVRKSLEQIRAPLVADLAAAIRRGDAAIADSAAQTPQQIDADRQEIEKLTARFKLVSAAMTPLREHGVQLDIARATLTDRRKSVEERFIAARKYLLLRVGWLIASVLIILGISELWRRGTFRYVRDARRRKQFLVLRRVVVSCVIMVAIAIGLLNEMGSLATYAGFLTAGLAVALQNPIASVVAYFFLIGRYGLKVGDRVTISGVTGDVVEIGLVRLYLIELTGSGSDLHPTGRVVGFSNSVLFQPAALFRQMPGAEYIWHAATLTLAPETDPELAESRLMAAVNAVYEPYRESVERQHAAFQRLVDVPVAPPTPVGRLRHTNEGLEFVVRYPAEMQQASATDDRILNALSNAVTRESGLALAPSGAPKLLAEA